MRVCRDSEFFPKYYLGKHDQTPCEPNNPLEPNNPSVQITSAKATEAVKPVKNRRSVVQKTLGYFVAVCLLMVLPGCGGCQRSTKDTAKDVTKTTVATSKEILSGMAEGIDEGRKSTEGLDGAVVISTHDKIEEYLDISVLEVKAPKDSKDNKTVEVVLAIANKHTKPVRLANLQRKGSMVLLDNEGFAIHLRDGASNENEITILPGLKERFKYVFDGDAKTVKSLRLYGHDYDLKP